MFNIPPPSGFDFTSRAPPSNNGQQPVPPLFGGQAPPPQYGGYPNYPPPAGPYDQPAQAFQPSPMYNPGYPPQQPPPYGMAPGYPPMQPPPQAQYGAAPPSGGQLPPIQGTRKALIVGINYLQTPRAKLNGCINDANNIKYFLSTRGFDPRNILCLTDDNKDPNLYPNKKNILQAIKWLVQGARPGDSLFFHFSGHGSQVKDISGDEDDGMDETILPADYQSAGQIIDDVLYAEMVKPLPPGCRLTSLMDCCHSGTGLDLPYVYDPRGTTFSGKNKANKKGKKDKKDKKDKNKGKIGGSAPVAGGKPGKDTNAHTILFAGCEDAQTSADTQAFTGNMSTGAMTYAFIQALVDKPNLSYDGILRTMRELLLKKGGGRLTQNPQMSYGRAFDFNQPFSV